MKTKALHRNDRKRQIMLAFAVELQAGRDARMTVNDIAKKLNLATSTKLRQMVVELNTEGLLAAVKEPMPGVAGFRVVFSPAALFDVSTGKAKREPRVITFRSRKNGQQTLWKEVLS